MPSYALVLGSAATLQADLAGIAEWIEWEDPWVIVVNDAGWIYHGEIDHWVSHHPANFERWRRKRYMALGGRWDSFTTWGTRTERLADEHIGHWGVGSSGLLAVSFALDELMIDRTVLAGVPMTGGPYAAPGSSTWGGDWPQSEAELHREGWTYHRDRMEGRVRSCSGWTRELLGGPDAEWLGMPC